MSKYIFLLAMFMLVFSLNSTDMVVHKTNGEEMIVSIDDIDQITFEQYQKEVLEKPRKKKREQKKKSK